jgi:hypothetical protein
MRQYLTLRSALLTLLLLPVAIWAAIYFGPAVFCKKLPPTGDAERDAAFDRAIVAIADHAGNAYKKNFLSYFDAAKGLSPEDFAEYVEKRMGRTSHIVPDYSGYGRVEQRSATLEKNALRCYSLKYYYNHRLVFVFNYAGPDHSKLVETEVALVDTTGLW